MIWKISATGEVCREQNRPKSEKKIFFKNFSKSKKFFVLRKIFEKKFFFEFFPETITMLKSTPKNIPLSISSKIDKFWTICERFEAQAHKRMIQILYLEKFFRKKIFFFRIRKNPRRPQKENHLKRTPTNFQPSRPSRERVNPPKTVKKPTQHKVGTTGALSWLYIGGVSKMLAKC